MEEDCYDRDHDAGPSDGVNRSNSVSPWHIDFGDVFQATGLCVALIACERCFFFSNHVSRGKHIGRIDETVFAGILKACVIHTGLDGRIPVVCLPVGGRIVLAVGKEVRNHKCIVPYIVGRFPSMNLKGHNS